eukprot:669860-Hanusia_phi.AAC.1
MRGMESCRFARGGGREALRRHVEELIETLNSEEEADDRSLLGDLPPERQSDMVSLDWIQNLQAEEWEEAKRQLGSSSALTLGEDGELKEMRQETQMMIVQDHFADLAVRTVGRLLEVEEEEESGQLDRDCLDVFRFLHS